MFNEERNSQSFKDTDRGGDTSTAPAGLDLSRRVDFELSDWSDETELRLAEAVAERLAAAYRETGTVPRGADRLRIVREAICVAWGDGWLPVLSATQIVPRTRVRYTRLPFESPRLRDPTAHLSPSHAGSLPPPNPSEVLTALAEPIHEPLQRNRMPSATRRFRESTRRHVRKLRDEQDRLGPTTASHRQWDLLRWPEMCRRAGLDVDIAGAADITAEQVLAVKRSGIWQTTTLKPIFSGIRTYCREEGNSELANLASVWKLPRRTNDNRKWLTEVQLAECYARAQGRVKVRVALQGFLGMREDSTRALLVRELMFEDPLPRMAFAAKGPDGERLTISVDAEMAGLLRSWVESEGLGPNDRVYGVGHSTADADLRKLGRRLELPFPLSGHVLRRSFARIAYLAKPDYSQVLAIKRILGHRDVNQTLWYIGYEYLDQTEALSAFHVRMRTVARPSGA